ncbi:MAG: hypothetical protein QMD66_02090 [Actinomycetota bacterium]|nr:hypothetical protein [Actinomycetota bacterium]MDI6821657.1 hypothetical protein [Actinomycetota bacterium]
MEFARIALGKEFEELVDYFGSCRVKRNIADYNRAGKISEKEAKDILKEARKFAQKVKNWVKEKHPRLAPD